MSEQNAAPVAEPITVGDTAPSFDDLDFGDSGVQEQAQASEEVVKEAENKQEDKEGETKKPKPSERDQVDGEGEDGKEEEAKGKEEEPKEQDEQNKEEEKDDNTEAPKATGKKIKGELNGEKYSVDSSMNIPVKIDGKREMVPLQDLINNYSGKQAYESKFNDLDKTKKEYEAEKQSIVDELKTVREDILGTIKEGYEGNPLDAFNKILDLVGIPVNNYHKKVSDYMHAEINALSEMSESEREAYFLRKENEFLRNRDESLVQRSQQEQASLEFEQRVNSLREAHGVSEDDFVSASEELSKLGYEDVSPEQAIEYAVMRPHINKAEELIHSVDVEILGEDGSENVVAQVADALMKGLGDQEIREALMEDLGKTKELQILTDKANPLPKVETPPPKKKTEKVELFDDYDDEY